MVDEEQVRQSLKEVTDPEIGLNVVDLGLIYDINVEGSKVEIDMTLSTPGCPMESMITNRVSEQAESIDDVESVDLNLVWEPRWTPEMISEEGKEQIGME